MDDYKLYWHILPHTNPTLDTRPSWLHQFATYLPYCIHTKFLHSIFMQVSEPFANHWRPVTRKMAVRFYDAITSRTAGLGISITLYLGPDEELYNLESDEDDASISITSEDDSCNQVLFLFRFWVNGKDKHSSLEGPKELLTMRRLIRLVELWMIIILLGN